MLHFTVRFSMLLLKRRTWFVAVLQAFLVLLSLVFAWMLRFDFSLPYHRQLLTAAIVLPFIRLAVFSQFNLLHGWWRYSGVSDVLDIAKATVVGTVLFWLAIRVIPSGTGFPRSVFIIEMILSGISLSAVRLFSRTMVESVRKEEASNKKVALIGAGFAAQIVVRELAHPKSGYQVLYCLDDDTTKLGIKVQGVEVIGAVAQLPEITTAQPVDEVLIAVPSATSSQMRRFVEICNEARVRFRTVPALKDIIAGQVKVNQLREVSLEDLLGRDAVEINLDSVRRQISGRTVLVTGAAGSIGSELCRQILEYDPAKLVCLDQSESGLFYLRLELLNRARPAEMAFCVADVTDRNNLSRRFGEHKPEIIFHAAAYKHVPMMEFNVQEAVKNNVLGLLALLDVADEAACKDFVLISSDKAVNPTNIMGATKRICELIVSSRPRNGMRCVSVRFGNVLGSSGSVVPVLKQQLQDGQPLTITHPEIKRFFMTTQEAVALVLEAFTIGSHGDILVLNMGEPIRIMDLARNLIRLSGKSEQDVEIRVTGLREGEKLKEEMFYEHEEVFPTSCEKITRTRAALTPWPELCRHLEELRVSLCVDGADPVRTKVNEIVPEYVSVTKASNNGEVADHPERRFRAAAGSTDG
jgi:FlaA1/EpsC-like NDP-sugar epimerase